MIEIDLPGDKTIPIATRSFAACMASMTETLMAEVPQPRADLPRAIIHWRSWLAGRGAGVVALAKPSSFNWPGYWLAVLGQPCSEARAEDATVVLMFGTPSGVVLSPQDPSLLGRAATDLPICEGYVLCCLDPTFIVPTSPLPHLSGTIEVVALAERATGEMHTVDHAEALANRGLAGDRYAAKAGTFTPASDTVRGYDLTLIEAEVLDNLTLPEAAASATPTHDATSSPAASTSTPWSGDASGWAAWSAWASASASRALTWNASPPRARSGD